MHRIAVFARNHPRHLENACAVSAKDPSRLITFRSAKRWASAKKALDRQETLEIYLSPIGSDGMVDYQACLKAIVLEPKMGDPETKTWLTHTLSSTSDEGLWEGDGSDGNVRTLYVLSHCRQISRFPMTQLRKADGGQPLSKEFNYSYALVQEPGEILNIHVHPEEIADASAYYEGAAKRVTVNAYERNTKARDACIKHYGTNCAVCGFNFGTAYGDIGSGFIHVHHLISLTSIKAQYQVDPVKDLRPVCPNCHAMLHRKEPPFSIEELATRRADSKSTVTNAD